LGEYPDPQDQYDLLTDIASHYDIEATTCDDAKDVKRANANRHAEMMMLGKVVEVCEPEAKFDDYFNLAVLEESEHPELVATHLGKAVEWSKKQVADQEVIFQQLAPHEASGTLYKYPASREQAATTLTIESINVAKAELGMHDPVAAREWLEKAKEWSKLTSWLPPDHSQAEIDRLLKLCDQAQASPVPPLPPGATLDAPAPAESQPPPP
jgi:hypothetical protein